MAYGGDYGAAGFGGAYPGGFAGACGTDAFCAPGLGACGPAACAPHVDYCAPAAYPHAHVAAPVMAPVTTVQPVAHAHHTVEAWGRPVWKKNWLLGKWKYAGLKDVQYIPRAGVHATGVPVTTAVPVGAAEVCAPGFGYGGCAPGFGGGCAPGFGGACAPGFGGAGLGTCAPGYY